MKTYSLKQLNSSFVKALIFTVILALLGGAGMFMYAKHKQQTSYTANRFVLISHNLKRENTNKNYPVTAADLSMMSSYEDIVKNSITAEGAKEYLPKKVSKKYSVNEIHESLNAKSHQDSLVLKISATTNNKKDSVMIVNAASKSFQKELPKLQPGAGKVHLLAKADNSNVESRTKPNKKKYVVVGVALGGLLGIIISFVAITWKKIIKDN